MTGIGTPFLGYVWDYSFYLRESDETPGAEGLDILPGKILKIPAKDGFKDSRIWDGILLILSLKRDFLKDLKVIHMCYFVHSYYLKAADEGIVAELRSILHIFMLRLKAAMCLHASSILKRAVM